MLKKRKHIYRWLWILVALLLLSLVVIYLLNVSDEAEVSRLSAPPPLPPVTVEYVRSGSHQAQVKAYAEVKPRWSVELTAAVSGRIATLESSSMTGEEVAKEAPLLKIEDSAYVSALADENLSLEEATLALRQAEIKASVTRKEFEYVGSVPNNDLALRLPQLKIARSRVKAAAARVKVAQRDLNNTLVVAPFSGVVTQRFVSPGQVVNAGDRLIELADNRVYEITVEIGRLDWQLMPEHPVGIEARVTDLGGQPLGVAKVRQAGGFLDQKTRQYKVFLSLKADASKALLGGDFVEILMPGKQLSNVLSLPETALTRDGYVWYVDENDCLQRFMADVLFQTQDRIVVSAPDGGGRWRVAVTPLLSFLPGQKVATREREN